MAYSSITKPSDYFDIVTWDTVDTSIDTLNFAPDFAWIKIRDNADSHCGFDTVRGATKRITLGQSSAESTQSAELTAFNSDGYTLGTGDNVNRANKKACSWNWLGGGTAVSNTDGSITSSVSANTTAGFSIVKFTGTGANATIGHGLSSAPEMVIEKGLDAVLNWKMYHKSLGAGKYINFDETNGSVSSTVTWNNTAPTSSVFSVGNGNNNNSSQDYITYCFHSVKGYSKVGHYYGNGNSNGAFIYTGFKPGMIFLKKQGATSNWVMIDFKRIGYNGGNYVQEINGASAEQSAVADRIDILSNGFKAKNTWSDINTSGEMYIYYAVAEQPLVANVSGGIPATAR